MFSAKIPLHFFQSGFFNFPIPAHLDAGYPPLWAWLVAFCWKIFGQYLWVSHLICLPILIATAWFYLKIATYFLPEKYLWFAALFLLIEPTYFAQSTMVGPDIFLVMAFMAGLYSILYHKTGLLIFMTILLSMTSIRGCIFVFILYLNQLIFNYYQTNNIRWKTILPYTISGVLFIGWMLFHYQSTGFLLVTDQSPWAGHHHLIHIKGFFFNIAITIWRFFDFGRVLMYGVLIFAGFQYFYQKKSLSKKEKILCCWSFLPLLVLVFILCIRTNPILHRYFMVYFLLHSLCLSVFLFKGYFSIPKKISLVLIGIALISGHCWIYPHHIAQGWDASLAHLPYFNLRQQMIEFIEEEDIVYREIVTAFPNINGTQYSNLSKQVWNFTPKHKLPMQQWQYVLQSNVMNDFSEEELLLLNSNQFKPIKSYQKSGVYMILYKKTDL